MNAALAPSWVFSQIGLGRWCRDLRTGELTWDQRMHELTGQPRPLAFEEWASGLAHPDDRAQMRHVVSLARDNLVFDVLSICIVRPDGEVRWLRMHGRRGEHAHGEGHLYVGVALDVTSDVLLQRRLAEAERLETHGRFSAGVSHNFNNMLMVVGACLEAIRARLGPDADPETTMDLDDASEATQRAADVVAQIAQIARLESTQATRSVSVSDVCNVVTRLARHALSDPIELEVDVRDEASVEMVPGSLDQVLQNLIYNARDALMDAAVPAPKITLTVQRNETLGTPWVEILVTDNGAGVDPAVEGQLFEPFVTTKGRGGTGLGLASSSAIVQRIGGHLSYRRGASGGAEFLVSLPVARTDAVTSDTPRAPSVTPAGRFRVLVVDDERNIGRAVSTGLRRSGFEAWTATNRASVEALLDEDDRQFDVVLLDRSLGLERGSDLVPLLRARVPEARVLYFTGEPVTDEELAVVDGSQRIPQASARRRLTRTRSRCCTRSIPQSPPCRGGSKAG